jgi:hypothetical protein
MVGAAQIAPFGADDTGSHGLLQAEGRADGYCPIADLDRIRIADLQWRGLLSGLNL